jgi:ribokinase
MRTAVVGHCEWVDFVRVERLPIAGEIVRGESTLGVPAGGGAVAAVQLARWGADSAFFAAFGDDALGSRARQELEGWGVKVHAMTRPEPQRRALTLVDAQGERTIIVLGGRIVAQGRDPLPWHELASCDAVYVTGGDAEAIRAARQARVVVATSRILPLLREAAIELDALVGSDNDPAEVYAEGDLDPAPRLLVRTNGSRGGQYFEAGQRHAYASVPTNITGDTYGAGDTFAAALTLALGRGLDSAGATAFAAARAAEVLAWQGPFPRERP